MERISRARVVAYDASAHTATVELNDAPGMLLNVPVAMDVGGHLMTAGREVALLSWADVGGVVLGPYGAAPSGDPLMPGERLYIYDTGTYIRRRTDASEVHLSTDQAELHLRPGDSSGHLAVTADALRPVAATAPDLGAPDRRFDVAYLNDVDAAGNAEYQLSSVVRRYVTRPKQILYPPNGTYFDLWTFTTPGGSTSVGQRGDLSGLLVVTFNNRSTGSPPYAMFSAVYFLSIFAQYTSPMTAKLTRLAEHLHSGPAITYDIRPKAGASDTSLTLEMSVAHANWYDWPHLVAHLDVQSHATVSAVYITPEVV
ncbi:MAG: hypothetical protein GX552_07855 [Chloroflexi bacterium]|jgi:hypothetical protein|nr:hypothetical protein [Chloroflexota bacterium]